MFGGALVVRGERHAHMAVVEDGVVLPIRLVNLVERLRDEEAADAVAGHEGQRRLHQQAEPYRAALVLALEQLQRADAAHRLEEVALLARGVDDLLLGGVAQRPVPDPAAGITARGYPP